MHFSNRQMKEMALFLMCRAGNRWGELPKVTQPVLSVSPVAGRLASAQKESFARARYSNKGAAA